jgi:tripartite motif-containing protein 71
MNGLARGAFGSFGSGPGEFLFPSAVAAVPDGGVFVVDAGGRLQEFNAEGKFVRAWVGLRSPRGVAVSGDRIYVSEGDVHQVRLLSRKGTASSSLGGFGSQPGRFLDPSGIVVDEDGAVYVADTGNHRIQKLDPDGKPLLQWGGWGGQAGLLSYPTGLGYADGHLTVADTANHRLQVFDRSGALVRQWGAAPFLPGEGAGRLHLPTGLAVSPSGGLVAVSEPFESRIQVFVNREQTALNRINDLPWWDNIHARLHSMRLAPPPPGSGPQIPGALASSDVHAVFFFDLSGGALGPLVTVGGYGRKLGEVNGIGGVAVDAERGRAWVSDRGNRRIVLVELQRDAARRELFSGMLRVVSSLAFDRLIPKPPAGYDPAQAVPGPLVLDGRGQLYLLDRANAALLVCDADFKFQRLIPVPPTTVNFAVAPDGSIYTTDTVSFQVQVFDPEGHLKTSWGRRDGKADDGFLMPWGIAIDDKGSVFVSDALLDAVKKFNRQGVFLKQWGQSGRKLEELNSPRGISFAKPDRLVIEDPGNHRAQVFSTQGDWCGGYVSGGLATPIAIR